MPIESSLFDRICSNRFNGRYPVVIKASGEKLVVNLLHSKQICLVDEDPTMELKTLSLAFGDHFYPKELLRWF